MWIEYGCMGFLGICAVYDCRTKAIPAALFWIFGISGLILQGLCGGLFTGSVIAGAAFGLLFLAAAKWMPEKLGEGDGWMLATAGVYLGFWELLEALLGGLLLMAAVSLGMLLGRKWRLHTQVPFAPFLFGAYAALRLAQAAGI